VSEAGLPLLLQLASGDPAAAATRQSPATELQLNAEAMAAVRARAYAEVSLPSEIIDLLTELRTYLQQTCEPPVYVSGAPRMRSLQQECVHTADACAPLQTVAW
jgi:MoxR-like ATPase